MHVPYGRNFEKNISIYLSECYGQLLNLFCSLESCHEFNKVHRYSNFKGAKVDFYFYFY